MKVIMIFIDGVGLGETSPANPFVFTETPCLRRLLGGGALVKETAGYAGDKATLLAIDTTLGVEGLPQSATGQASIFTGENAARYSGGHRRGFPGARLRKLLADKGIFKVLKQKGLKCAFLNAYRPPFFEQLPRGLPGRRYSCSTLITFYGGIAFRSLEDLRNGQALYMDIDHSLLRQIGFDVPAITVAEAAGRLVALSERYDFTLFEFFLSDLAGHLGDHDEARKVVLKLDTFLGRIALLLENEDTLLVVASDHGNLEDLSHRQHTLNPAPCLLIGPPEIRAALAPRLRSLTDYLAGLELVLAGNTAQ